MKDESVDLVYLDPPFNSQKNYNMLFKDKTGKRAAAQIKTFKDTWGWDEGAERAYVETVEAGGTVAETLVAFRSFLKQKDMMAYLSMMAPRLVELRRAMKPTASLFLHCDPTASHYLKVLLDAVFGAGNFVNEIAWCYDTGGRSKTYFPRKHDTIFWYSKTCKGFAFHYDQVAIARDPSTMHESVLTDEMGRSYQRNMKNGREYRYYLDKGVLPNDWWTDIPALNPAAKERLDYPTQKPVALLERIINSVTLRGEIVLDPFCGCGTSVDAAQKLGRTWIGIDITALSIDVITRRLSDGYGADISRSYRLVGEPTTVQEAEALAKNNKYQFQFWAIRRVGASPASGTEKKGADGGIDGRKFFHDGLGGVIKQIILSVKGGKLKMDDVRSLAYVVEREKAVIGVLISSGEPTPTMRADAAAAGFYTATSGEKYPRIQLLSVGQLLNDPPARIEYPHALDVTHERAPRVLLPSAEQTSLM
ncbi:MAG: hypothetical protein DIJKHBIC_02325 [Thermoanaerobaculia bacterium]|nr:hypothetical protein [Thermoanaerobaculia bacterium]